MEDDEAVVGGGGVAGKWVCACGTSHVGRYDCMCTYSALIGYEFTCEKHIVTAKASHPPRGIVGCFGACDTQLSCAYLSHLLSHSCPLPWSPLAAARCYLG